MNATDVEPPDPSAPPKPGFGSAILIVLLLFAMLVGVFVFSGIMLSVGIFLLPPLGAVLVLYLAWYSRRRREGDAATRRGESL